MSDKTEREKYLKVLEKMFYSMEKLESGVILPTSEVKTALAFAISSIKTDLKYDLLYEETTHIANVSKMIEPTADNDSAVDCIVDVLGSYTDLDIPYKREIAENILTKLPSVTPQEPFINKPCISSGVCEQDKNKVLDKIRAEITAIAVSGQVDEHTMFIRAGEQVKQMALDIIDKYKAESEPQAEKEQEE